MVQANTEAVPHPLEIDYDSDKRGPVREPIRQRLTANLLKSFMEQSNIRWIELISASLIVICSVGLVISLWSTLSSTSRFFPSLVFMVATIAVHGAGQYTLKQWKLRTTSRGILHIGLMLIPLAVLIGILLSRRPDGPPAVDMLVASIIGVGTLVYGALAVTASRSLFSRRWVNVASLIVVSSLTLLPIHFLGEHQRLQQDQSILVLVPLLFVCMGAAFAVSRSSIRLRSNSSAVRRIAGIVTQSLFATLIPFVFWFLQARSHGGIGIWWWVAMGVVAATWASWGWTASLLSNAISNQTVAPAGKSWFTVVAWVLASIFSVVLIAALWQTGANRIAIVALLISVAGWWLFQGWICNLRIGISAGGIALLIASTFLIEGVIEKRVAIQLEDWIGLQRISILTLNGIAGAFIAFAMQRLFPQSVPRSGGRLLNQVAAVPFHAGMQQLQIAGVCVVFVAAILTLAASLLPQGETPYGGNWAALFLITYGILAIGVGATFFGSQEAIKFSKIVFPIGQGILLLGTIRLCQTSPILEGPLGTLRPDRAWSVGTAMLAVGWSLLAACLRVRDGRRGNSATDVQVSILRWLSLSASFLGAASILAIWSNPDHLRLAGSIGWYLPLGCIAIFIALRMGFWRELSLIGLAFWICSLAYTIGERLLWWESLGLACSVSTIVAVVLATLVLFEQTLRFLERFWGTTEHITDHGVIEDGTANQTSRKDLRWFDAPPRWASASLIVLGWIAVSHSLLGPFIPNLVLTLGWATNFTPSPFALGPLQSPGLGIVLVTGCGLACASAWIGKKDQQHYLLDATAVFPLVIALGVGSWVSVPYSIAASLWSLTILLIGSELLQFRGNVWQDRSLHAWHQLVAPNRKVTRDFHWLTLGRGLSVALLFIGTTAIIYSLITKMSPLVETAPNGTGVSNLGNLMLVLGPALVFGLSRWAFSIWNGEFPTVTSASAIWGSIVVGFVASLSLTGGGSSVQAVSAVPIWPSSWIVWGQSFGLSATILAFLGLGFIWARNFLGLRRVLGAKLSLRELATKAMKGARWQRSEKSSWEIVTVALTAVVGLGVASAFVVITFPINRYLGFERLGSLSVVITAVVTLLLFWFLYTRRGASNFGMLATALGLLSPIGGACYLNWLTAVPTRMNPAALGFEPLRVLVFLWLIALAIGLIVRFIALAQKRTLSRVGEIAWILLAVLVGCLALVSTTQDPEARWPFYELSWLACIAVMSGLASGQMWRGHVAAFAAAAGFFAWVTHRSGSFELLSLWNVLWGPIWIGLLSIVARMLMERSPLGIHDDDARVIRKGIVGTVEQSVSLLVPLGSGFFSFIWFALDGSPIGTASGLAWSILGLATASVALAIIRLWEPVPAKRGLAFYLNLISCCLVFASVLGTNSKLPLMQNWLIWLASGLGGMAIIAGLLREMIRESSMLGPALKFGSITEPAKLRHAQSWMPIVHSAASLLALIPCIALVMSFEERSMRVAATVLPFIGAISILPIATEKGKDHFRYIGLTLISSSLILLWWADLPSAWSVVGPENAWVFVHRAFVAFVLLGVLYPIVAHRLQEKEEWVRPLMRMGWILFGIGILTGAVMLGGESAGVWNAAAVDATLATKGLTLAAWIAVTARLLQFAAYPHATDRVAPEDFRTFAVYVAEFALAFLCGSCYYHFPDLFAGLFLKWWPLVVFAIAMLSAGIGEWLKRVDQKIIADPIARSSLLLPILPLVGVWWFRQEGAEWLWSDWGRYSFLLLSASMLYGLQSWIRNSIGLRVLASLLVLCSFWTFLHSNPDLRFVQHPQFWILPPALAALIFVEFNRRQLDPNVVVASRYVSILIAYLSSTAEVFLKAFEGQIWQPLLLLILALVGVGAGILMRVRAFLYCGLSFTMVALLGMVWHAQQAIGQVWPWWAFGIATGISLIVLLGYFEKNRSKVLAYLEHLKKWEK